LYHHLHFVDHKATYRLYETEVLIKNVMGGIKRKQARSKCVVESVLDSEERRFYLLGEETAIDPSSSAGSSVGSRRKSNYTPQTSARGTL
jgi:hypothetical protein